MSHSRNTFASVLFGQRKRVGLLLDRPADLQRSYEAIANDPQLKHFVRIPERILRCLRRFDVACNHDEAHERLESFYLFIGVVDNAIDHGQIGIGDLVLAHLGNHRAAPAWQNSRVGVATEVLKHYVADDLQFAVILRELSQAVIDERVARTIQEYLQFRRVVGSLTAELSYFLIRSSMDHEYEDFRLLLKEVGAVGCLVDSVIDFGLDYRSGLLAFRPCATDYAKLTLATLRDGLSVIIKHPRLWDLFLHAIIDNVLDRLIRNGARERPGAVSRRRDEATGVV
jgi:hypothetical protein